MAGQDVRDQGWFDFPGTGRKFMNVSYSPYLGIDSKIKEFSIAARDITEEQLLGKELEGHCSHLEELIDERTAELSVAKRKTEAANRALSKSEMHFRHAAKTAQLGH